MVQSFLALAALVAAATSPAAALWPQPRSLDAGSSTLRLAPDFHIAVSGAAAPADLRAAVQRTAGYLATDKLERLVVGRGASDQPSFRAAKALAKLTVALDAGAPAFASIASEAQKAPEDRDEAYALDVPADGSPATLTANSTLGLLRGLTTFGQLWYTYEGTTYTPTAPLKIEDSPVYVRPCLPCVSSCE